MLVIMITASFLALLWAIALFFGVPLWIPACVSALALVVLGAKLAWSSHRARKAAREIEASLASQAKAFEGRARPDQRAEARALAVQFEKALDTLKGSKLARGRSGALYALPWYVIIGPPGAGKSTAIRQSGLKFPTMGSQSSVRGVGGTRNCDWWLTNEAVLLDTAGRYATHDDDREEWLSFLDILKGSRPKRPLNGLIVAISVGELAAASDRDVDSLASKIRERIDEVMARLEIVLPVYVLLTKADLLPGFMPSFEELKRSERAQVLGFTLPLPRSGELAACVDEQWTRLVQVVERKALERMPEVRSPDTRQRIYEFPQHLEALGPKVSAFLSAAFVDNVYQEAPIVRGVYLTSGTQVGTLVDQVMGAMASAFGLSTQREVTESRAESKAFFLEDLFRSVMFPDQELAARSALSRRRIELARALVAGVVMLSSLVPTAFAARSFVLNRAEVLGARAELAAAIGHHDGASGGTVPLELLEPLRTRLRTMQSWQSDGAPWAYRMGLYQGDELSPQLRSFYTKTLRSVLMEPLMAQLSDQLRATSRQYADVGQVPPAGMQALLYERLRAYLLLSAPRDAAVPALDAGTRTWLEAQLVALWAASDPERPPSPAEREAMAIHLGAYLELLASDPRLAFTKDNTLVADVRSMLSRVPAVKLAVDRIVAMVEPLGWDLGIEHVLGASGLPITATGRIRGAFTRRAWEENLRALFTSNPDQLLGDAWVFTDGERNQDETTDARACALRSEYFGRYVDEWRAFIGTLRMEEPREHERTIAVLQDLTRGQPPPLERVMRTVAHNAQLLPEKKQESKLEQAAEKSGMLDKLEELRKRVESTPLAELVARKQSCASGSYVTEASVRDALSGFYAFGASLEEPQAGVPAPLTSVQIYQEQLTYVRDAAQAYSDDAKTADSLTTRLAAARTRVRSLIETQQVGWRPRFDALLWPPISGASASTGDAIGGERGSRWCTSVQLPFARTLRGRYPFSKTGQDVALADLAEFYRPTSGVVAAFYESVLRRDIAQVGASFQPSQTSGGPAYNQELIKFLNKSAHLGNVLFPARAEKPRVDFEVRVRPAPGIAQVLFNVDGQEVDFHNGPEKWIRISWPGNADKPGARMRVKGASIDETLGQDGEWGLFRLIDKGTVSANPEERFFTVRWRLHTQNDVTIDFRPARAENPFVGERAYLEAFRADGVQAPSVITSGGKSCAE